MNEWGKKGTFAGAELSWIREGDEKKEKEEKAPYLTENVWKNSTAAVFFSLLARMGRKFSRALLWFSFARQKQIGAPKWKAPPHHFHARVPSAGIFLSEKTMKNPGKKNFIN